MMVIEHMDRGSLYDLMHNETLEMDIHIVLPILRDVAAGALMVFCCVSRCALKLLHCLQASSFSTRPAHP